MEWIYEWAGNILFFLILMSLAETLLPSKKYENYLRFFGGMVLILLVIRIFPGESLLEEKMNGYLSSMDFSLDARGLEERISAAETWQQEKIRREYEALTEANPAAGGAEEAESVGAAEKIQPVWTEVEPVKVEVSYGLESEKVEIQPENGGSGAGWEGNGQRGNGQQGDGQQWDERQGAGQERPGQ